MNTVNTVSFVIRTYNEAKFIGKLFDKINSQINNDYNLEFIVVDSSTDETAKIAKSKGAIVIDLPKAKFNYASALNIGIKESSGELIIIMSAHSIPVNNDWLSRMISHFKDEKVSGVYCKQIPWPEADWREKYRLEMTFKNKSIHYSKIISSNEMAFSNAASCIRRSTWEKHNFMLLPASEDREWAQWAIEDGNSIVYDAEALIYHSHNENPKKTAMKIIEIAVNIDKINDRKRNMFLIFKNAAGWFIRDIKLIFTLNYCKGRRIKNMLELLACIFWFILDFQVVEKNTLEKIK